MVRGTRSSHITSNVPDKLYNRLGHGPGSELLDAAYIRRIFCCDAVIAAPLLCHHSAYGNASPTSSVSSGGSCASQQGTRTCHHKGPSSLHSTDTLASNPASTCHTCNQSLSAPALAMGALVLGVLQGVTDPPSLQYVWGC